MEDGTGRLFVYGTLKSTAQGALGMAQRAQLVRESRLLGAAVLLGAELFDLGRYPGLVLTTDETQHVHGEVVELHDPAHSFAWLDDYEGFSPGEDHTNDYNRVEHAVRLVNGEITTAWVYVFLKDLLHRRPIPSGRW
jgi:gamma-glutamylcyclotransferase (GGCT)/AIG2-like uncharacterized protein YtfP